MHAPETFDLDLVQPRVFTCILIGFLHLHNEGIELIEPRGVMMEFPVKVKFHKGFELSLYLFALISDNLMATIQDEGQRSMLFPDDIILISHSKNAG